MIDTHCHLLGDGLRDRLDAVLADSRAVGAGGFITGSEIVVDGGYHAMTI